MFEFNVNYTENKVLNGERVATYHYDILNEGSEIGYVVALHNKNNNTVSLTVRVKWLDSYTSSGTARRMLQQMIEGIIYNKSSARIKFNELDAHTVALLELSGISHKIAFN